MTNENKVTDIPLQTTSVSECQRHAKLELLAELEGFEDSQAMLSVAVYDSLVPAICMTPGCDASAELEPDADGDHCDQCGGNTLSSCLIIADVI